MSEACTKVLLLGRVLFQRSTQYEQFKIYTRRIVHFHISSPSCIFKTFSQTLIDSKYCIRIDAVTRFSIQTDCLIECSIVCHVNDCMIVEMKRNVDTLNLERTRRQTKCTDPYRPNRKRAKRQIPCPIFACMHVCAHATEWHVQYV